MCHTPKPACPQIRVMMFLLQSYQNFKQEDDMVMHFGPEDNVLDECPQPKEDNLLNTEEVKKEMRQ